MRRPAQVPGSIRLLPVGKTAARPRSGSGFIAGVVRRTAISLAPVIVSALHALAAPGREVTDVSAELQPLAVNFQRIIPGYAHAALIVVQDGPALALGTRRTGSRPYRSSLLVGSVHEIASAQLLVRATSAGAFATLADDFRALTGQTSVRAPLVDLHLDDISAGEGVDVVTADLADLSALNQAVGALLDRGWLPLEAADELHRIGSQLGVATAVAARLFMRGMVRREVASRVRE
jgi:hypothetical protein